MKYIKHLITITKHKYYVAIECFKQGLYWQGIVHDLSKYSLIEFFTSAKYFQGDRTPVGVEKAAKGYSEAWLHHKGKNKHHWEYWTDFYDGKVKPIEIPTKYILEIYCDMIGASKAYNKDKYTTSEPLKYFEQNISNWLVTERVERELRKLFKNLTIKH